jgi:hypothetical protein
MKKIIKKRTLEERKLFFARNLYKVKLESLPKKIETKIEIDETKQEGAKKSNKTNKTK